MSVLLVKTTAELTALEGTVTAGDTYFNSDTKEIRVWDSSGWRAYKNDGTTDNLFSLEFDGGDRLDTTYRMTSVQNYTVMFWMKSTNTTKYICPVADTTTGQVRGNFELLRTSSNSAHWVIFKDTGTGNNAKQVGNFSALCDGEWHHVAYVFDSSGDYTNVKIYEDGGDQNGDPQVDEDARIANGWQSDNKTLGSGSADFAFGQRRDQSGSNLGFPGKMDQMAFFESALSSTDISNIYNSGNGGDLLALGFSPAAYYRVGYYSDDTNSDGSVASAGQDILTVADYSGNGHNASQSTTSLKPNYVADPAF